MNMMKTIGWIFRELLLTNFVVLCISALFVSCGTGKNIPYYYQIDKPPLYISQKDGRIGDNWFVRDLMQSIELSHIDSYPNHANIKFSLIIDQKGQICKVRITKDNNIEIKRAIIKALKQTSKWEPGLLNGECVKCVMDFSIHVDSR